jgi:hypothetical protein
MSAAQVSQTPPLPFPFSGGRRFASRDMTSAEIRQLYNITGGADIGDFRAARERARGNINTILCGYSPEGTQPVAVDLPLKSIRCVRASYERLLVNGMTADDLLCRVVNRRLRGSTAFSGIGAREQGDRQITCETGQYTD